MSGAAMGNVGAQQQKFNEELFTQGGRGAGLDQDYKLQLSNLAAGIGAPVQRAGMNKRQFNRSNRSNNMAIKSFHEALFNNPNIPHELKLQLAEYAKYPTLGVSGDGKNLAGAMGASGSGEGMVRKKRGGMKKAGDVKGTPVATKPDESGQAPPETIAPAKKPKAKKLGRGQMEY